MPHPPRPGRRPTLRLPTYDDTQPGGYFITICTQDRRCLFGEIIDGEMHPTDAGRMVDDSRHDSPTRFPHISLVAVVVMPNHLQGIILIGEERPGE